MTPEYFRTLFDYNYWARDRVLGAAAGLSREAYEASNGFTYGSLRGILVHALSAEWIWRRRWQDGVSPARHLTADEVPTLPALRARWLQEEAQMRAFLDTLTQERLGAGLPYASTEGEAHSNILWHLMAHVINHSTSHRSEAAEALTMLGHSPGDLDMIQYFRGR